MSAANRHAAVSQPPSCEAIGFPSRSARAIYQLHHRRVSTTLDKYAHAVPGRRQRLRHALAHPPAPTWLVTEQPATGPIHASTDLQTAAPIASASAWTSWSPRTDRQQLIAARSWCGEPQHHELASRVAARLHRRSSSAQASTATPASTLPDVVRATNTTKPPATM